MTLSKDFQLETCRNLNILHHVERISSKLLRCCDVITLGRDIYVINYIVERGRFVCNSGREEENWKREGRDWLFGTNCYIVPKELLTFELVDDAFSSFLCSGFRLCSFFNGE